MARHEEAGGITRGSYVVCQKEKFDHQALGGLLHPLPIPVWKFEDITMDFVSGFPLVNGKNAVWVRVDRLIKVAHFIPIWFKHNMEELVGLYVENIVKLHEVPKMIISDRDPRLTLHFWKGLHPALGTKVNFSTPYHP